MHTQRRAPINPFALMMDPQAVIDAVEKSGCLEHLERRVCRPLDKPLIPKKPSADLQAFDESVDDEVLDLPETMSDVMDGLDIDTGDDVQF